MTRAIGIDLAWGARATSAAVVLEGREVLAWENALTDDHSILAFVDAQDTGGALAVGIDAPTCVPNLTGRRPCEALLSQAFRRYEAGPHPANRRLLAHADGTIRGERLVAALARRGIVHTPFSGSRTCFEVYPHPAHIGLFHLTKTLKYKAKPGRSVESLCGELQRYAALLATLPLEMPPWALIDPSSLSATGRKRHEDALDALTCAYVALLYTQGKTITVGDMSEGHVVLPDTEEIRLALANASP